MAALFSAGAVLADEPPKWGAHLDVEAKPGNKRKKRKGGGRKKHQTKMR